MSGNVGLRGREIMKRRSQPAVLLSAVLGLAAGLCPLPAWSQQTSLFTNGARTIYEAIDFASPRSAAAAFFDAWARHDYVTAHLVLSPQAQTGWHDQVARTFGMDTLFPGKGRDVMAFSAFGQQNPDWQELASDLAMNFDATLRGAEKLGALPFSVGPSHAVASTTTDQSATTDHDAASVEVETDGKPKRLTVQLVRLPSGRWKVDRILLPGALASERPWGFAIAK